MAMAICPCTRLVEMDRVPLTLLDTCGGTRLEGAEAEKLIRRIAVALGFSKVWFPGGYWVLGGTVPKCTETDE